MPQPASASALTPQGQARLAALSDWFASPLGQELLRTEQAMLDELLPTLFGYHLAQLSVQPAPLHQASQIQHKFSITLAEAPGSALVASAEQLPLETASIDLTLVHHLLDYIESPQAVLREIARATISMGNLVVIGFNPLSLWGVYRPFAALGGKMPWTGNFIRPGRLMDWLNLLDFKIDRAQYAIYGLPFGKSAGSAGQYAGGISRRASLPVGAIYVIAARKQVAAVTPMEPDWKPSRAFGRLSVVRRQIITPPAEGECANATSIGGWGGNAPAPTTNLANRCPPPQ